MRLLASVLTLTRAPLVENLGRCQLCMAKTLQVPVKLLGLACTA